MIRSYSGPDPAILIRPYVPADFDALFSLFKDTVQAVCIREYTADQIAAWVDCADPERWKQTLAAHYTLVAETGGSIAGFADLDGSYFDRLYVHKDRQGMGIATALAEAVERRVKNNSCPLISVHASITALPFFTGRGYQVVHKQQVERNGQILVNYLMEKEL